MQQGKASFPNGNVAIFRGKYRKNLGKRRVKESAQRWYMKGAVDFIKAAQGWKLHDHRTDDTTRYLEEQGWK